MHTQTALNFFAPPCGRTLRDEGMQRAADHAGRDWAEDAYMALTKYLGIAPPQFMGEDIREFATGIGVEQPAHLRAWGSIISRAARAGLIRRVGFAAVKNASAHCANASVWARA